MVGWTSLVVLLSVYSGLILFSIAIVGAYVARVFEQGQQRPLYWVRDMRNLDPSRLSGPRGGSREVWLSSRILQRPPASPGESGSSTGSESDLHDET